MLEKIKHFYTGKPWTARLLTAFLILFLVVIAARLALSPGIIYGAESWLRKQGVDSDIEAVRINIIDGSVSLINARGSKDGQPIFNIGLIEVHWQWRPLSKRTVNITRVALDSLSVDIKQYSDAIIISGITLPLGNKTEAAEDEPAEQVDENVKSWAASLGQVAVTNLDVCYSQYASTIDKAASGRGFIDYCVELAELHWEGAIGYGTDSELMSDDAVPLSSTGDFTLNGLSVTDNRLNRKLLVSQSNSLDKVTLSGLDKLHIDRLEMNALSLLQRDDDKHIDSVRFSRLEVNDITLSDMDSLDISSVSVSGPGVYLVRQNQADWEYQQWIPQMPATEKQAGRTTVQADSKSVFRVSLNKLVIRDSDLCYLDNTSSLYYCLTFADLGWRGAAKYSTAEIVSGEPDLLLQGDFELTRPSIRNHNIGRNLLDFASLTLPGLRISGINDVALDSFALKELQALQRGEQQDDSTVSFDLLSIDNVSYAANNIAVNTIDLAGLAATVSKNKNAEWEHDKWLTGEKAAEADQAAAQDTKTAESTKARPPLILALNRFSINSDKQINFRDNSTQPAMEVGLDSLNFDISKLDSARPDVDSPFKLLAKTSRHSTIDIAGTIRPLAEKISLDAKGKLKGLDLRVASPAVRKAAGHIIQSGQLDADLDLKAIEGKLDSKVALSLYRFQMKSVSKDDAKKLDEKFGMPLNQALKLLRDKDDNIHLDIPITGDINNPEFDPMDAILTATTKATTVTLITFYTPYGLIYHGGKMALDLASALNFDPIIFEAGSAVLPEDGKKQLDNLAKLLNEKPQVHLTMCGITNQLDANSMFKPETAKTGKGDQAATEKTGNASPPLSDEQFQLLKQLASERQNNSKNYLVDQHSIDHSRLILCEPEHNTDADAIAGVDINI